MRDPTYRVLAEDYPSDYGATEAWDDEAWDDDSWDDESWDDEAAPSRQRFNPRASTRFVSRPTPTFKPSPALGAARVSGGAGAGQVKFDKPVATAQAIEQLKAETRKAIGEVRAENKTNFNRIDDRLKTTATQVDKLTKSMGRVGSLEQRSQMMALLPLLQSKPKPTSIQFAGDAAPKAVTDVKFADDKNDMLMPLILMGGLGGTGGSGGQDQSNMMLLAIALMR